MMGDPSAPVTIDEHSPLTCPHCRAFHVDTLPRLKKEYIDTGKVNLVYFDFPSINRVCGRRCWQMCATATLFPVP